MCIIDSIKKYKYIIIIILIIIIIYLLSNKNEYLDASAVDPSAVDPSAVDPSAVDPSAVDPSAVDPSVVDTNTANTSAVVNSDSKTNGFIPTNTHIKGGYSKDRGDLYVCKIKKQDPSGMDIEYSGQIASGETKCVSTDDGLEIKGEPILFNATEYDWVHQKDIATPTGFSYDNFGGKRTLYSCRGIINDNNSIQVGKAWRNYNFCNIPYNGEERLVKPYDFLRIKKSA